MAIICAYARYEDDNGDGVNGLAPTWDIDRVTRADGTRAALVTGGATSITFGRRGLYGYVLSGADLTTYDYLFTAITADATPTVHEVAAVWTLWSLSWHDILTTAMTAVGSIGKLLVDRIDAAISSIRASVVAAGGSIGTADLPNIVRYVTYSETISGLTIAAGWQTIELTIKERPDDTDANALLNIIVTNGGAVTDGLIVLQKQTAIAAGLTAADASLTVDQAAGTVAVYITHTATGKLTDYAAPGFDLIQNDGTDVTLLTYGKTNIYPTETH